MRFLLTLLFLAGLPFISNAQDITGKVLGANTSLPVADVVVANKRNGEIDYTDSTGSYYINAAIGDTLLFYRIGYSTFRQKISKNNQVTIMQPVDVTLGEVAIVAHSYKLDSIERTLIYGRYLRDARKKVSVRPGFSGPGGLIFYNLPSQFAKRLSGRLKREKHFLKQFEEGEKEKFIRTRYNIPAITKITGLAGDDAAYFMNTYPMEHDYARTASDLEVYAWIKDNYRQYINKNKPRP